MKRLFSILLALILLFAVASCSILPQRETAEIPDSAETRDIDDEDKEEEDNDDLTEETMGATTIETKLKDNDDSLDEEASEKDRFFMIFTYRSILEKFVTDQVLPGGVDLEWGEDVSRIRENNFSVYDIDEDGEDELMIRILTGSSGQSKEYVYGYDSLTGELKEEYSNGLVDQYFDNGCIVDSASHNHSQSSDFWPYYLFAYNKESDAFLRIADVEAWDRTYGEDDAFPEDIDQDGDGIVYIISSIDDNGGDVTKTIDFAEYDAWFQSNMTDANEIEVPFIEMTKENIIGIK